MNLGTARSQILLIVVTIATCNTEPHVGSFIGIVGGKEDVVARPVASKSQTNHAIFSVSHTEKEFADYMSFAEFSGNRRRRSAKLLAQVGVRAVDKLLEGAQFLYRRVFREKVYAKKGDYKQAVKDFQDVDPVDVKGLSIGSGIMGKVGDRTIYVLEQTGYNRIPTMSIYKRGQKFPEKVIQYYKQ